MFLNYGFDVKDDKFIYFDIESPKSSANNLRKIKLVYLSISAASNSNFQSTQNKIAKNRIDPARGKSVNNKKVKDYITSLYGTALVIDQDVIPEIIEIVRYWK